MTTFYGWRDVPPHLMPATALGELEFPRDPDSQPVAGWVEAYDWRDKRDTIDLYDARSCPPTTASAKALEAAARRSDRPARRVCADCGARCQRPLPPLSERDRRRLCPACRHIARLRATQADLAGRRQVAARHMAELLGWADLAAVQVDLTVPPPAPSGRTRPPTAVRVHAVDSDGARLVDVTVRLVGPRARWVPDGAVDRADAVPAIGDALLGRRLVAWDLDDLTHLHEAAPHEGWPSNVRFPRQVTGGFEALTEHIRAVVIAGAATAWRGQLDPHTRQLVPCIPPGTPDRLLLLVRRMVATAGDLPIGDCGGIGCCTPDCSTCGG